MSSTKAEAPVAPTPSHDVLERVRAAKVVAVVRAHDGEEAVLIAQALAAGGIMAIELTFTTPGAGAALAAARERLGEGVLLGAGTITAPEQVDAAAAAGADFLVSPHLNVPLLEEDAQDRASSVPGVLTPSEVVAARAPGRNCSSSSRLLLSAPPTSRRCTAPSRGCRSWSPAGSRPGTAREWLAAGAVAVGLGSELVPKELREAHAWDEVSRKTGRRGCWRP